MGLYLVTVAQQLIVQASNGDEAAEVALDNFKAEDGEPQIDVERELRRVRDLPKAWQGCYPWGGDGRLTVEEILDATQEEDARQLASAEVKAKHSDMFDETPNAK